MDKKDNENISSGKAKVVGSTSYSNKNIQPRVVLQRLSKDYTFGVASGSDNQPSTSGYLSPKNKSPEVDSNLSDNTSGIINSRNNSLVTPSTSKPTTSGTYSKSKEVIEFRVAPLREANLLEIQQLRNRHHEDSSSDCSFHSSPKEVVVVEESKIDTEEEEGSEEGEQVEQAGSEEGEQVEQAASEEGEQVEQAGCQECTAAPGTDKLGSNPPTIPENTGSEVNCVTRVRRPRTKIKQAICFLKLLIDTYGREVQSTIEIDEPSGSGSGQNPAPVRRPVTRSIVISPQRNKLKDCLVRVWLSIHGQKKKKKFHVRLSQLILLLKNKNHPLHKFRNTLNLRTLAFLSDNEIKVMARVLSDFACAKRVKF